MPRTVLLTCDVCRRSPEQAEIVEQGERVLCVDDLQAEHRRALGQPVFRPTQPFAASVEDFVDYSGAYPSLQSRSWTAQYLTPLEVSFLEETLTPEQALTLIEQVAQIEGALHAPRRLRVPAGFSVQVHAAWGEVPLHIVTQAIDEFLLPALNDATVG